MKAGILAAGTGSRFCRAGWAEPKPLIRLGGKPIIRHVADNLFDAGVDSIEVLLNAEERFDPVQGYLEGLSVPESRIRVRRRSTRSSFETFRLLMDLLAPAPFVISTVDSILDPADLRGFLRPESYPGDCALALAVTDYVNDEKPLWAALDPDGRICRMGEEVEDRRHVTAGLYLVLRELPRPSPGEEFTALRFFLQHVLHAGGLVHGRPFRTALDIDDPGDVRKGEEILRSKTAFLNAEISL